MPRKTGYLNQKFKSKRLSENSISRSSDYFCFFSSEIISIQVAVRLRTADGNVLFVERLAAALHHSHAQNFTGGVHMSSNHAAQLCSEPGLLNICMRVSDTARLIGIADVELKSPQKNTTRSEFTYCFNKVPSI